MTPSLSQAPFHLNDKQRRQFRDREGLGDQTRSDLAAAQSCPRPSGESSGFRPVLEESSQGDGDGPRGLSSLRLLRAPARQAGLARGQPFRRLGVGGRRPLSPGSCVQQRPGTIVTDSAKELAGTAFHSWLWRNVFFPCSVWGLPEDGRDVAFRLFVKRGKATKYRPSIRTLGL